MKRSEQAELAFQVIQHTGTHLFLTGKAGTGKTTFLKQLKDTCHKRMIVVAPTGVAAMNAGGVTIHSFFQLPFGPYVPGASLASESKKHYRFGKEKVQIIRSLDLLVIDEISMVRADLLDAVSDVLKRFRGNDRPFGGVQLLMIGDLQQLAPVVKEEEWSLLQDHYASPFFFDSQDLRRSPYWQIELSQVYRQSDTSFVELLNEVRTNQVSEKTLQMLNERYLPGFQPDENDGYITLTTHNYMAQQINARRLEALPGKTYIFDAEVKGDFPAYTYPTEERLELKQGAQVMFIKNDSSAEKLYYNGKIGRVVFVNPKQITIVDQEGNEIKVERETWTNIKYTLHPETKEIEETTAGTFSQYPLKLAWAITIHKSQGLTFDRAIIDAAAAFSHGQVYVALSRCRSLEGLVLSTPLSRQALVSDRRIDDFTAQIPEHLPKHHQLVEEEQRYYLYLLCDLFDFGEVQRLIQQAAYTAYSTLNTLYPDFCRQAGYNREQCREQIVEVGNRFQQQLRQLVQAAPSYAEDERIQDRVRKGCAYFLQKLADLCLPLLKMTDFELDNKEDKKQLYTVAGRLREELNRKRLVLKASENGFTVTAYLAARAKAAVEEMPEEKKRTPRSKAESVEKLMVTADILHPDLYELLRNWRLRQAQQKKLPAYTILQQKALIGITNFLPASEKELLAIPGIGKKVIELYGEELLAVVEDWKGKVDKSY